MIKPAGRASSPPPFLRGKENTRLRLSQTGVAEKRLINGREKSKIAGASQKGPAPATLAREVRRAAPPSLVLRVSIDAAQLLAEMAVMPAVAEVDHQADRQPQE